MNTLFGQIVFFLSIRIVRPVVWFQLISSSSPCNRDCHHSFGFFFFHSNSFLIHLSALIQSIQCKMYLNRFGAFWCLLRIHKVIFLNIYILNNRRVPCRLSKIKYVSPFFILFFPVYAHWNNRLNRVGWTVCSFFLFSEGCFPCQHFVSISNGDIIRCEFGYMLMACAL